MNKSRLAFLFEAYINKTATPAERDELMTLLEKQEHEALVKQLLTESWDEHVHADGPFSAAEGDQMLAAILQEGKQQPRVVEMPVKRRKHWPRIAVAAAILLCFAAGGYWWLTGKFGNNKLAPVAMEITPTPIVPGGSKAVLTLADGRRIELDSSQFGMLAQQGDVSVVNHNTSVLSYNTGKGNGPVVYNTLSTPRGGQYQLQLADGTKVWLNASSTISYPVEFREKERVVTISGEAYFEVAKNPAMPFKVITQKGTVEVLGTHFNVMAYEDEQSMKTTLLEGSVKVHSGSAHSLMKPGWQTQVLSEGNIYMERTDVEMVMAWKNGQFYFRSDDVPTIMRQVARWYDVDIQYKGKVPEGHFSGIVNRDMDIDTVLKIMQEGGVQFAINGHKIIVGDDRQRQ